MWSKSLEILNPYEATLEALAKEPNQEKQHETILAKLARILHI